MSRKLDVVTMMGDEYDELVDGFVSAIERAANFMRGMSLDPRIPTDTKTAITSKINELEQSIEKYL